MIYTILISICFLFSIFDVFIIKDKKNRKCLIIVFIIIYTFIFGRRGFVAWDWVHYYPTFINIVSLKEFFIKGTFGFNDTYEFGYMLWLSFCKTIFNNYDAYVFFTTFLDISLLSFLFLRYSPYPIFSVFTFLIFGGFGFQLDLMRNIKALILFLFSLNYIKDKKYFKVFLLVILSLSIHRTSLIYLFLILTRFLEKERKKKHLLIIFFIGIFVYIFGNDFLKYILKGILNILDVLNIDILKGTQNKLNLYLNLPDGMMNKGIIKIGGIEKIITFFIIYFNYEKIKINNIGKIFLNLYTIYIIIFFYTNGVEVFHDRMEILFISSYWVIYSIILSSYTKNKKKLFFLFISMMFFAKYINYYKNTLSSDLYKYETLVKNDSNYNKKYKLLRNEMKNKDFVN